MGQTLLSEIEKGNDVINKIILAITIVSSFGSVNIMVVLSGTAIVELFTRADMRVDS